MANLIRKIENDNKVDALLNQVFTNPVRSGYVEVGNDKVCLPNDYINYAQRIQKFDIFDDDVFLAGFPKSGTTWCQEMIWLLMNNLDFDSTKIDNVKRYRLLEMAILYDTQKIRSDFLEMEDPMDVTENLKRPRCLKTHLNWSLLPEQIQNGSKQPKIINLVRNPKDSCVSHYHFSRFAIGYSGTFEEFCEIYLAGRVPYGPYWKHILSFWNQKHRPNILYITFEEMVKDLPSVIKKVAQFLGKTITDEDITKLVQHLSFDSMKKNPAIKDEIVSDEVAKKYNLNTGESSFFHAGKVGNFKTEMSFEMEQKFSAWTEENLSGTSFNLLGHI